MSRSSSQTSLDPTSDQSLTLAPNSCSSYWSQIESFVLLPSPQCSLGLCGTYSSPRSLTPSSQIDQTGAEAAGNASPGALSSPSPPLHIFLCFLTFAGNSGLSFPRNLSPVRPALIDLLCQGQPEGWFSLTFWFCVVLLRMFVV